jgi:hypothetical protein
MLATARPSPAASLFDDNPTPAARPRHDAGGNHPRQPTWAGEPVRRFACALRDLPASLPRVERRPLLASPVAGPPGRPLPAAHRYRDLVVRLPFAGDPRLLPVAVVSKRYTLVQHADVAARLRAALVSAACAGDDQPCDVALTEYGGRLHVSVPVRPPGWRRAVGDAAMELRVHAVNGVDGVTALHVWLGWLRLVCDNGLAVPAPRGGTWQAHVASLQLDQIPAAIAGGLEAADRDAARWEQWLRVRVGAAALDAWADNLVTPRWGLTAAARLLHIVRTGRDARLARGRPGLPASAREVIAGPEVPGSAPPNDNLFRVGQALAWVAKSRAEVDARFEREHEIHGMLVPLRRMCAA